MKDDKNKRLGKAGKVIAATAMSVAVMTPSASAFATPLVHHKTNGKKNESITSDLMAINVSDIVAHVNKPIVQKYVNGNTTTDTNYKSENEVPSTGDIATAGTSFNYQLPIDFRSKSGQSYNLNDCSISISYKVSLLNGDKPTPQEEDMLNTLKQSIETTVYQYNRTWLSTGSYVFNANIKLGEACYNAKITPVVTFKYHVNGKEGQITSDLPPIKVTKKYSITLGPCSISTNNDELGLQLYDWGDGSKLAMEDPANIKNENTTAKPTSYTFNLFKPDGVELTPIKSPYLVKNANGSYTITGPLLDEVLKGNTKLFKITYPNKPIYGEIGFLPVDDSAKNFSNYKQYVATNNFNFSSGGVQIEHIPENKDYGTSLDKFVQDSQDTLVNLGNSFNGYKGTTQTKFSSNINSANGSGVAYIGSAILNGKAIFMVGSTCYVSVPGETFVDLPKDALQQITYGTPKEKAEIWNNILNGKYETKNIFDALRSFGKPITFTPNFVYTQGRFSQGKSTTIGSNYYKYADNGSVSKSVTSTYLVYNKGNANDIMNAFKPSDSNTDQIFNNSGKVSAIISPSKDAINNTNPYYPNTTAQSSTFRDNAFSHGVSASNVTGYCVTDATFDKFPSSITDYDIQGRGLPNKNILNTYESTWLSEPHSINVSIGINSVADSQEFSKAVKIEINLGGDCNITGPITLDGNRVSSSDYSRVGNKLYLTIPKTVKAGLVKVTVPVQYTDMNAKQISISATPVNAQNYPLNYNINNTNYTDSQIPSPGNTSFSSTVNLICNKENYCQHYTTGVDAQNKATLTDTVNNMCNTTITYNIVGRFPTTDNSSMAANSGYPSVGGLGSNALSINTSGAPVWVLPNNALSNPENKQILDSTNVEDLAGLTPEKLKELGWVPYTNGMDLSHMVGYVSRPTVKPGDTYTMTYNVKLTGVNPMKYQTVSSQYKYYDTVNNIGSTSPVVTLYPQGEDAGVDWDSAVVVQSYGKNSAGQTIITSKTQVPQDKLIAKLKDLVYKSNTVTDIKGLFSHGPDVDPNAPFDLTPPKLMDLVNFAIQNKEALADEGYKLDYITVNGVNVGQGDELYTMNPSQVLNWFNNIGIATNTTLTHVHFILSKLQPVPVTVQVKVVDAQGKVIDNNSNNIAEHTVANPYPGSEFPQDKCGITVPKGYKLVKVTIDGKDTKINGSSATLPNTVGQGGDKVVYYIEQIPTKIDVQMEYPDGKIVSGSQQTITGEPGTKSDMTSNSDNTEVTIGGYTINIPKGYKVEYTTVTNEDTNTQVSKTDNKINDVTSFRNYNTKVVIHLVKKGEGSVTVSLKNLAGNELVPTKTTSGYVGDSDTSIVPTIPKGYHLVKVIDANGSTVDQTNPDTMKSYLPKEYKKGNVHITYIVAKDSCKVNIIIQGGPNGTHTINTTVPYGTPLTNKLIPNIPEHYHIVSVNTDGNSTGKDITGTATTNGNKVVIKIEKDTQYPVTGQIVTTDGKVLGTVPSKEVYSNEPWTDIPSIPAGYHLVKTTLNNTITSTNKEGSVSGNNTTSAQHIVWTVEKDPTGTVTTEVIDNNGNVLVKPVTTTGVVGSKDSSIVPNIPKGYHLVGITDGALNKDGSITVGSKTENGLPGAYDNGNQVRVWHVEKDNTTVNVTIKTVDGKVLSQGKTETIKTGSPLDKVSIGTIPAHYHITKVEVNDKTMTNNKVEGNATSNPNHIVITVSPNPQYSVDGEVVTTSGKVLSNIAPTKNYVGEPFTETPNIPQGYHLVNTTLNGNKVEVSKNDSVTGKYIDKSQHVVWTVEKDTTVITSVVTQDGRVLVPPTTYDGIPGESTKGINTPKIPKGYKIVKVVENDTTDVNGIPSKYPNKDIKIVWVVEKTKTAVDTEVVTQSGQVLVPVSKPVTIKTGSDLSNVKLPLIPEGYHLVGYETNGQTTPQSKVDGVAISQEGVDTPNHIKVIVAKDATSTVTTKIITTTGEELGNAVTTQGIVGSKDTSINPSIPDGYHIVKITNNEGNTVTGVPNTYGNKNTTITWVVEKDNTNVDVTVKTTTGQIVIPTSNPETVKTGSPLGDANLPNIPSKWQIVGYETNGQTTPQTTVEGNAVVNKDKVCNHIVVIVQAKPTSSVTTKIVTTTGEEIGNPVTTTGVVGDKDISVNPIIPHGYHIVKVVDSDNSIVNGVPENYTKNSQTITWVIEKDNTNVDVTVKTADGTIVVPTTKAESIKTGSPLSNVTIPNIPHDYTIVGYETDGGKLSNKVTGNAVINKDKVCNHIVVIVKKVPSSSVTTEVIDSTGHILVEPQTTTGLVGDKDTSIAPKIPAGYKVVKITEGNNEVNGVPSTYTNQPQVIVWHVIKENTTVDTTVVTDTGKVVVPTSKESTIATGSPLNKVALPNVPKDYKVIGYITNNGKMVNSIEGDAIPNGNHIKIVVKKVLTQVTTGIETTDGKVLFHSNNPVTVNIGSPLDKVQLPKVPYGYKVVGYKVNNGNITKDVNGVATSSDNTIKIIVEKIPMSSVTTQVKTENGKILVNPTMTSGLVGSKDTSVQPNIPEGYHIVKIVNQTGDTVVGLPNTYSNKPQTITWIVAKNKNINPNVPVKGDTNKSSDKSATKDNHTDSSKSSTSDKSISKDNSKSSTSDKSTNKDNNHTKDNNKTQPSVTKPDKDTTSKSEGKTTENNPNDKASTGLKPNDKTSEGTKNISSDKNSTNHTNSHNNTQTSKGDKSSSQTSNKGNTGVIDKHTTNQTPNKDNNDTTNSTNKTDIDNHNGTVNNSDNKNQSSDKTSVITGNTGSNKDVNKSANHNVNTKGDESDKNVKTDKSENNKENIKFIPSTNHNIMDNNGQEGINNIGDSVTSNTGNNIVSINNPMNINDSNSTVTLNTGNGNVEVNTNVINKNSGNPTNPKTGDNSELPYALGIIGSALALFGINKRKKIKADKTEN